MGLKASGEDISGAEVNTGNNEMVEAGWMRSDRVVGKKANLALFERGDYHSSPHRHTAEQLNLVLEGEVWWYVEDEAYLLTPGDFHRVPANAVHWAEVRVSPVRMVEAHAPPLVPGKGSVGLYADDETPEPEETSENLPAEVEDWREREAGMKAAYFERHPEDR